MRRSSTSPTRTCVGCGSRDAQPRMIRLREAPGQTVVVDAGQHGRSAYVHAAGSCVEGLLRSKGLGKSLRIAVARPARLELIQILEDRLARTPSSSPAER